MKSLIYISTFGFLIGSSLGILPCSKMAGAQVFSPPTLIALNRTQIESEAKRWTTRLTGFQWDYYKKHSVFAKTPEQILSVMSPNAEDYSIEYFRTVLKQHYEFVIKEKSTAIYTYAIPRSSGLQAYSSMDTFKRSTSGKFTRVASAGCNSREGTPPEPSLDSEGKQQCTSASNISNDISGSKSSSTDPSPSNNDSLNEIKKRVPRIFNGIFK